MQQDKYLSGNYEEEEPRSITEALAKYWYIWLPIIIYFVAKGRMGDLTIDKGTLVAFGIFVFGFTAMLVEMGFKHQTPKLISNPIHTTTLGVLDEVGNYALFRMGDIKTFESLGIYSKGTEGTIVVPKTAVNPIGENIALTARVERVRFEELPFSVKNAIIQKGYPSPYYLGYTDESMFLRFPDLSFLIEEIKQLNSTVEFLRRFAKIKMEDIEKIMETMGRLRDISEGGMAKAIKNKLFGSED